MDATIDECGILIIQAETPLESYALNNWAKNNFSDRCSDAISTENIVINIGIKRKM